MSSALITTTLSLFQPTLPLSLFFLSGIAATLSIWIVPLLLLPTTPSRTIIHQFNETINRGRSYLQPSSRLLAFLLLATTTLTAYHPDANAAAEWKVYGAATFVLVQTAWWEEVFIFPINDRVAAMEGKLKGVDGAGEQKVKAELEGIVREWRWWHFGRIAAPFVAGCLTLYALL